MYHDFHRHNECYAVPLCKGGLTALSGNICFHDETMLGLTPHRGGRAEPGKQRLMIFILTGDAWKHEDFKSSGISLVLLYLVGLVCNIAQICGNHARVIQLVTHAEE